MTAPQQAPAPSVPVATEPEPVSETPVTAVQEPNEVPEEDLNTQALRRERLRLFGGIDITDITICIGYKDPNGNRQEVIRQVQESAEFRIIKCAHDVEEQMAVKKSEGEIVGHEPTGKYRLKLDAVFIRN